MKAPKWLTPATIISILAFVFSIASFIISYFAQQSVEIQGIRPILVFEYDQKNGWILNNIGNGPAMNGIIFCSNDGNRWLFPVRIPAIRKEGSVILSWFEHTNINIFGAIYEDFEGRPYSSIADDDLTRTLPAHFIDYPAHNKVIPHWSAENEHMRDACFP